MWNFIKGLMSWRVEGPLLQLDWISITFLISIDRAVFIFLVFCNLTDRLFTYKQNEHVKRMETSPAWDSRWESLIAVWFYNSPSSFSACDIAGAIYTLLVLKEPLAMCVPATVSLGLLLLLNIRGRGNSVKSKSEWGEEKEIWRDGKDPKWSSWKNRRHVFPILLTDRSDRVDFTVCNPETGLDPYLRSCLNCQLCQFSIPL